MNDPVKIDETRTAYEMISALNKLFKAGQWEDAEELLTSIEYRDSKEAVAAIRYGQNARKHMPRWSDIFRRAEQYLREQERDPDLLLRGIPKVCHED